MQTHCDYSVVWERWDDPGARDGGGSPVPSYRYPEGVRGTLTLRGETDEEIPAWVDLLELVDAHAPVTGVAQVDAHIEWTKGGAWQVRLMIESFDGEVKDRD